jgi:hypothetical protein
VRVGGHERAKRGASSPCRALQRHVLKQGLACIDWDGP